MTHCDDGALRAFLDGELRPGARSRVQRHLTRCAGCRTQLASVGADAAFVSGLLGAHGAALAPSGIAAETAFRRWHATWGPRAGRSERTRARRRARWAVPTRGWLASAAAAAAIIGMLLVPPVRAAAGDFLQLFRVQHVQVLNVSDADATQLEALLQSHGPAVVDVKNLVRLRVTPSPAPLVVTLPEARAQLPFVPLVPQPAPAGASLAQVQVRPQFQVEINHLNMTRINALLASVGSPQALPAAFGDADIQLMVPASMALTYQGGAGQAPIHVLEGGNPALSVSPATLAVSDVRNMLLNLPFLPDDLRAQLRAVADWQHTALIPQVSGVSQAVRVNGTQGAFVRTGPGASDTALVWLQGEVVYAIQGAQTLSAAQAIAASLQ